MAAFNIGGVNVIVNLAISQKVCDVILDVCEGIKNVLEWLLGFLPDDPLDLDKLLAVPKAVQDVLGYVNWLVPLGKMLAMVATWFAAIMLYQVIRFGLKAAHVI